MWIYTVLPLATIHLVPSDVPYVVVNSSQLLHSILYVLTPTPNPFASDHKPKEPMDFRARSCNASSRQDKLLVESFVAGLVNYLLLDSGINNKKLDKAVDDYGVSRISKERDTGKGTWRRKRHRAIHGDFSGGVHRDAECVF